MSYRCCACAAPLPTFAAMQANRDVPIACARCGVRQFSLPTGVGYGLGLALVLILLATVAAWIAPTIGVDDGALSVGVLVSALVGERALAVVRGRMRPWAHSVRRARAWFAVAVAMTLLSAGVAIAALAAAVAAPIALEDVAGRIERTWGGDGGCVCLRLQGSPVRYRIDGDDLRRLPAGAVPPLQAGTDVVLQVARTRPADAGVVHRVYGFAVAGETVLDGDRILRRDRWLWGLFAAFFAVVAALQAWGARRQWRDRDTGPAPAPDRRFATDGRTAPRPPR